MYFASIFKPCSSFLGCVSLYSASWILGEEKGDVFDRKLVMQFYYSSYFDVFTYSATIRSIVYDHH